MISKLILAWKNHYNHDWVPVGKLSYADNKYFFEYTESAKKFYREGQFAPFSHMIKVDEHYESEELFPIFKNRLLPKSRPEYNNYLNWLKLSEGNVSPISELARSGGIRATDDLQLFPYPEQKNGNYEVTFFSHGIRYLPPSYIERLNNLRVGDKLYIMSDLQNDYDSHGLVFRTNDPVEIVGYAPRFFSFDFNTLIRINNPENIFVKVEQVNYNAPSQFRLLCKLTTLWPPNFKPFKDSVFD